MLNHESCVKGNARTTPPHLHFGTFVRNTGPLDPLGLVFPIPPEAPSVRTDLGALGEGGYVARRGVRLRRSPSRQGSVIRELEEGAPFLTLAGTADWYRVLLPGGGTGYLHSSEVEVEVGAEVGGG